MINNAVSPYCRHQRKLKSNDKQQPSAKRTVPKKESGVNRSSEVIANNTPPATTAAAASRPTSAVVLVTVVAAAHQESRAAAPPNVPTALASDRVNATANFAAVANRLRNSVMSRGFFRTLLTWQMTAQFRGLPVDDRVQSLEFLRWCRDLFLVFTPYCAERAQAFLERGEELGTLRTGAWHQGRLFEAWHEHQQLLSNDVHFQHPGWLRATAPSRAAMDVDGDVNVGDVDDSLEAELLEDLDEGRAEHIRLLSLDSLEDPRNDRTVHDIDLEMF